MYVNINEIVQVIESITDDEKYAINTITSEILPLQETDESNHWIVLPTKDEIDDYGNMESFIETVSSSEVKTWLRNAIHGRGAFRMFRATLERFGIQQDWYTYREMMHRTTAIEWCEYYGIEYDSELPVYDDEDEETFEETRPRSEKMFESPYRLTNINKNNIVGILYMAEDCAHTCTEISSVDDIENLEESFIQRMRNGAVITAVSDKGKFVAYSVVNKKPVYTLEELYVRPEYRCKGIGSMLLKHAEEEGVPEMNVSPGNELFLRFLERNGYNFLSKLNISKNTEKHEKEYRLNNHLFLGK